MQDTGKGKYTGTINNIKIPFVVIIVIMKAGICKRQNYAILDP